MDHWLVNEGNSALMDSFKNEGITLQINPVEFVSYEMSTMGGIQYNEKGETSLDGLYAAGDKYFGGISCAAAFGWSTGENPLDMQKNTKKQKEVKL